MKVVILLTAFLASSLCQDEHPCDSPIYCYGDLLHTAQMSMMHKDSKTFVDMAMKYEPDQVLANFTRFIEATPKPSKEQVVTFVNANFEDGTEFVNHTPSDWQPKPQFLNEIEDEHLRKFGEDLHEIWNVLGRKIKDDVKDNERKYSIYYVDNHVIVPGGRFKEFYYWDSYWIQKGLLVSDMKDTVKGMIENFMQIVDRLGFIPNGGRIYYQRSQPALLIPMVKNYYDATNDADFIKTHINTMIKEFNFFLDNRIQNVTANGVTYAMVKYSVKLDEPRPESYREDLHLKEWLADTMRGQGADETLINKATKELYYNLKSGAESGWDFSSRWFVPLPNGHQIGDLFNTRTSEIIPVDLNGYLCWNAALLKEFCTLVNNLTVCDPVAYQVHHDNFKAAIEAVLWDEESGSWFDYDYVREELRKAFYPTNLVPLWVKAHHNDSVIPKVLTYLNESGATSYPGGIPTSLFQTGQQWDFPNGWAPLQHIVVEALENSNNEDAKALAFDLAQRWVQSNHKSFILSKGNMFEKYDVSVVGGQGGGGEYEVVIGFGWSNGVVLDFMKKYGKDLKSLPDVIETPSTTPSSENPSSSSIISIIPLTYLLTVYLLIFNIF